MTAHKTKTHDGVHKNQEKKVNTNIQETLDRLRELDQTASPAPWYIEEWEGMIVTGDDETGEEVGAVFYHTSKSKKSKANAAILTEVRNSLPDLLAEIDRLTAESQALTDQLTEARVAIRPLKEKKK